ncbi:putative membrane protein [Luteimicrobium xylanilyticum]|uniref:Putative membrane protein n=1 Tax=Luteimicrobium xylanilyticum TaxID=1133546 RepID=A0A5P9QEK6_9MICO|nr:VTT domain-containing protein [Luteimicrobium xylanilyticum]QFU99709.1 putative membrane protein [Luteimicrobium xylanilyticum]
MTALALSGELAGHLSAQLAASPLDLIDPNNLIDRFGSFALAGIVFIVFIETGLVFPFLPGDSLLFTAGMLVAATDGGRSLDISLPVLIAILFAAAFCGNQCGYAIGKFAGPRIFSRPDSKILRKDYVDKTNEYFDRYGGRTILLAQFVPIVRTFAPIAAGVGRMRYRSFWPYSLLGTFVWTTVVTTLGYYLGRISFIRDNIEPIFIGIVLLSVVPIVLEARRKTRASRAAAPAVPGPRHGRAAGVTAPTTRSRNEHEEA